MIVATVITVVVGLMQFKDQARSRLACCRPQRAGSGENDNDPYGAGVVVGADSKPEGEQPSPG
jgi:hypothetical protein